MKFLLVGASMLLSIGIHAETLVFTTEDAAPFNFLKEDEKTIAGIGPDIIREMQKRTKVQASINIYPWKRAYIMATEGKNTCVFSTTRTPEREALFKWVGPLIKNTWVLYGRSDTKIKLANLDDAKTYSIGTYNGDILSTYFKEHGIKTDDTLNDTQNLQKLKVGHIDLWAAGNLSGPYLATKNKVKVKALFSFHATEMYLACNPSVADDSIQKMNKAIKTMWMDGTIDKINLQYGAAE